MIFQRPRSRRRRPAWVVPVAAAVVLILIGIVVVQFAAAHVGPGAGRSRSIALDTDGDGITDRMELAGWQTRTGIEYQTDPRSPDSDGDGLLDGEEAGPVIGDGATFTGRSDPTSADGDDDGLPDALETGERAAVEPGDGVFWAIADPLLPDTDEDGVGDGDELFLDLDPTASDTDDDGLSDVAELRFGSDPTLRNADEDHYDDAEEYERGSDPLSYDLTASEKLAATQAGMKYGDCEECAEDAGLRIEQIESAEYLAGHVVSGLSGYGDFRDLAVNLWKKKFLDAGLAAIGFVPALGDGAKAASLLVDFARRGDRAEQAVRDVTTRLPLSESVKRKILAELPGSAGRLPVELAGGPQNYIVYRGENYVGITDDFARRAAEHARAGRSFTLEPIAGATGLSRGEARAIEQACIEQGGLATAGGALANRINSIDPSHSYAAAAVEYGHALLSRIGGECPV